jgi:hypothetical protein
MDFVESKKFNLPSIAYLRFFLPGT